MDVIPSPPLSYAVVGCGLIGRKRAAALPTGRLRYACDLDAKRAGELAAIYPGCNAVTSIETVLQDHAIAAVIISTLNRSLAPLAMAAVRARKHVLVEKPGALRAAQLRELAEAARTAGVVVRIGYNHRFHPALLQARQLVDTGAVGPLMFLRGRYGHGGRKGYDREWRADPALSGGGELIDQGVHLIDLATWFLGESATVEGHAATYFWDMKVDDNAFVSLRTPSGATAWLHVSCTEWKNMFSLEIYGRNGKIAIEGLGGSYGPERCTFYKMLPQMGPPEVTIWEYPPGDASWTKEIAAFEEDICSSRVSAPDAGAGARILEIVEDIYRRSGFPTA